MWWMMVVVGGAEEDIGDRKFVLEAFYVSKRFKIVNSLKLL